MLALWTEAGAHPSATDDLESLERLLAEHPGALIVAEDGRCGRRLGDRRLGRLARVDLSARGRPIPPPARPWPQARREAEGRFERLGAIRLNAIVVAADDHATSFWRSSGWDEQSERIRFVKDG